MLIELHALQYLPFSNVNRDSDGAPKIMNLGGTTRARWSSQSMKRRMLSSLAEQSERAPLPGQVQVAARTRWLPEAVVTAVRAAHPNQPEEQVREIVRAVFNGLGLGTETKTLGKKSTGPVTRTNVILQFAPGSQDAFVAAFMNCWNNLTSSYRKELSTDRATRRAAEKKQAKKNQTTPADEAAIEFPNPDKPKTKIAVSVVLPAGLIDTLLGLFAETPLDAALFGRFLAELKTVDNCDAAVAVSHAFTTHEAGWDFDYWTAMDTVQPDDETGASMMGDSAFVNGVFYRYTVVDLNTLLGAARSLNENVAPEDVRELVRTYLAEFINLRPKAMSNATAPYGASGLIHAVVRDSIPISGSQAFIRPVTGPDMMGNSAQRLQDAWNRTTSCYRNQDGKPLHKAAFLLNASIDITDPDFADTTPVATDQALLTAVLDAANL